MNTYEAKQEARRQRLKDRAEKAGRTAAGHFGEADRMAHTMDGQPILIGHHSEKRHRRDVDRLDRHMRQGIESADKADHYRHRAASVGKGGISSDDPDAPDKIRARIADLEKRQASMKGVNKALRTKDPDTALRELGLSDAQIERIKVPDFLGRIGFPQYALTNSNGNIRRLKQRLEVLERQQCGQSTTEQYGAVEIRDSVEDNRVQIVFPGKPSAEIREKLKRNGFRWSPTAGAWQRHRSEWAFELARSIVAG